MSAIVKHEGKFYLIQPVCGDKEGWDDFEVCAVEFSQALIRDLRQKLILARTLNQNHGISEIRWYDYSCQYYGQDWESEAMDEDGTYPPMWTKEPGRTDGDQLCVQSHGYIYWRCEPNYSDYGIEFTSHGFDQSDLNKFETKLVELMAKEQEVAK